MKTLLTALAFGALLVGTSTIASAQETRPTQDAPATPAAHGPGGGEHGPGGGHGPIPGGGGHDPIPGGGGHDPIHGGPGHDPIPGGGGHDPIPGGGGHDPIHGGPGHDPIPGGGGHDPIHGGPDRWHGPEHTWGGWGDRNVFHGAWFWFDDSYVMVWDGAEYIETPVFYDPVTDMYYWVDGAGISHWLN
jgi:hypothetical protein